MPTRYQVTYRHVNPQDGYILRFKDGEFTTTLKIVVGDSITSFNQKVEFTEDVVVDSSKYIYLGDSDTNGTWRIGRDTTKFVIERRVTGSWKRVMEIGTDHIIEMTDYRLKDD